MYLSFHVSDSGYEDYANYTIHERTPIEEGRFLQGYDVHVLSRVQYCLGLLGWFTCGVTIKIESISVDYKDSPLLPGDLLTQKVTISGSGSHRHPSLWAAVCVLVAVVCCL
jgi:hypothetical protein